MTRFDSSPLVKKFKSHPNNHIYLQFRAKLDIVRYGL